MLQLHPRVHLVAGLADDAPQAAEKLIKAVEGQLDRAVELAHDLLGRRRRGGRLHLEHVGPQRLSKFVRHRATAKEHRQIALVLEAAHKGEGGVRVGAKPLLLRAAQDCRGDHAVDARSLHPADEAPVVRCAFVLGQREGLWRRFRGGT